MKRFAMAIAILSFTSLALASSDESNRIPSTDMPTAARQIQSSKSIKPNLIRQIPINTVCNSIPIINVVERRGCCSHHGGVCGCDESVDKIKCCDGTLSPSCTCSGY